MNLDNTTFLGDFDDLYTLRLLDGTLLEIRINLINDQDISSVIVQTIQENTQIKVRPHRVHYTFEPLDRLYVAVVEPPAIHTWFDENHSTISFNHPSAMIDAIDAFDMGTGVAGEKRHFDSLCIQSCSDRSRVNLEEVFGIITEKNVWSTNHLIFGKHARLTEQMFKAFDEVEKLTLSEDNLHLLPECVQNIRHTRSLRQLVFHMRSFDQKLHQNLGVRLAECPHLETLIVYCNIFYNFISFETVMEKTELNMWKDWKAEMIGLNNENIMEIRLTRDRFEKWGELLEV